MSQLRRETTIAIIMFTAVLLGNVIIFSIVPFLSASDLIERRMTVGRMLGFFPAGHAAPGPIHAFEIMLCYSCIAALCMLPWAWRQGLAGLRRARMKHYWLRAVLEYGSFTLSFYSLSYLGDYFTLPMHTALNFITPIFATVAAIFVLKERGYSHTWLALAAGIAGVLIITRPGMIPLSPGVLYVMFAAIGFSLCGIVIKLLCATESSEHIAFYMLVLTALLAVPMGVTHWSDPGADGWFWLAVIGVTAYLQQVYVARAIAKVPYMVLIPLNFSSLLFSTAFAYIVYGQLLDGWTFAGSLLILFSTLYNAQRNRALAAREAISAQQA